MKTNLTKIVIVKTAICLIFNFLVSTSSLAENPPRQEGEQQPHTDQQKVRVKSILSKYDASSLTADDAKAIHRAFRDAGLQNGPDLNNAIKEAGFDPEVIEKLDTPRGGQRQDQRQRDGRRGNKPTDKIQLQQNKYSIEQAISDKAQLNTIAFDALAFFTGDFCCNTFLPPGKVSDFFGFQYMRDIDAGEKGHNTSFLTQIANNVIYTLNNEQKAKLIALGKEQSPQIRELALKRFPLIKAFRRQLEGDIPAGTSGLNKKAVMEYCADNFELDGLLAFQRAQIVGGIIKSLDEKQKSYLAKLKFGDSQTWPEVPESIDRRSMPHDAHVAVMTYASEMFSWYAGSVEADTYFCPERHGTYFGGFYMKDIPAMGKRDYSISTSLTGDSGESLLAVLTVPQCELITDLVDIQRSDLNEIVKVRRAISVELRRFMKGEPADKEKVLSLSRRYGELDGEIAYYYATAFAKVYKTLSNEQKARLVKLRNLADYPCTGAYVYSERISTPEIKNTDFLFNRDLVCSKGI